MSWSLGRAVVTGGAGFIGSHLIDRLLARDVEVICVDSFATGRRENVAHVASHPRFRMVERDVVEPWDVEGRVDAVVHLASPASPVDYHRLPIATLDAGTRGTRNALGLAATKRARFLLASTSEVYGDALVHPQVETYWGNVNPIGPRSVYDEAKRAAEAYVMAFQRSQGVDTRIARIFNTFGARMRPNDGRAVPQFVTQALSEAPMTVSGNGTQTRSLCYVDDLVEGLLRLLASDYDRPVNLGNPHEVTILELADVIRTLCNSGSVIVHTPLPEDDPKRRCPDITTARAELGWSPSVTLRDGLQKTIDWWRINIPSPAATQPAS